MTIKEKKKQFFNVTADIVGELKAKVDKLPNSLEKQDIFKTIDDLTLKIKSQNEILRLADLVSTYRLNEESDARFKSLIRKEIKNNFN